MMVRIFAAAGAAEVAERLFGALGFAGAGGLFTAWGDAAFFCWIGAVVVRLFAAAGGAAAAGRLFGAPGFAAAGAPFTAWGDTAFFCGAGFAGAGAFVGATAALTGSTSPQSRENTNRRDRGLAITWWIF